MTPADLIAFEKDIADCFNRGEIRAPVHLDGGNEQQLIDIFKDVGPSDWICGSWRQHYHCLLKGVPPAELKADILAGKSITLCYPKYRIISSAIVGGILPIAQGIAWEIKRQGGEEKVHAFLGDMTGMTGLAFECANYGAWNELPIRWILEDNGKSVCTETMRAWGVSQVKSAHIVSYDYEPVYPHAGAGQRVNF